MLYRFVFVSFEFNVEFVKRDLEFACVVEVLCNLVLLEVLLSTCTLYILINGQECGTSQEWVAFVALHLKKSWLVKTCKSIPIF